MQLRTEGDIHILTVLPRIDANNAKDMDAKLQDVMKGGAKKVICSFTANEYVSSAGLRVFLAALKAMNKSGGRIVLCSLKPYVQEVFEMAGRAVYQPRHRPNQPHQILGQRCRLRDDL